MFPLHYCHQGLTNYVYAGHGRMNLVCLYWIGFLGYTVPGSRLASKALPYQTLR